MIDGLTIKMSSTRSAKRAILIVLDTTYPCGRCFLPGLSIISAERVVGILHGELMEILGDSEVALSDYEKLRM